MIILSLILLAGWFFTGPREDVIYPSVETSSYLLPWDTGISRLCSQGNRSFATHRGLDEFAWDFFMPVGSKVLAARGGRVAQVSGNSIAIIHIDGSRATYDHLRDILVKVEDHVDPGQHIANSGFAFYPHLHFHVTDSQGIETIPITFRDVPGGIPLAARFYRSQNGTQKY